MKIDVTELDIKHGQPCNDRWCPIAIAASRATGRMVEVGRGSIEIGDTWFELPEDARDFVAHFDAGRFVCPFSFELSTSLISLAKAGV